jgi:hypothetical protein
LSGFVRKREILLLEFLGLLTLAVEAVSLFLEDAVVVVEATHDSAGRGLLNAEKTGSVGSGHAVFVDHSNQLQPHLSGPVTTSRVYLQYRLPSGECSAVSIDFL